MKITNILLEQAFQRKTFMLNIKAHTRQILQNMALIKYARKYANPQHMRLIDHWKVELAGHLLDICQDKLKNNDTYQARYRAAYQVLVEMDEIPIDKTKVTNYIRLKFRSEHIPLDSKVEPIVKECMQKTEDLLKLIADFSESKMYEFIDSL